MPVSQQGPPGSRPFLSCPVQPVELGPQQKALLPELPSHMLATPRSGQHPLQPSCCRWDCCSCLSILCSSTVRAGDLTGWLLQMTDKLMVGRLQVQGAWQQC